VVLQASAAFRVATVAGDLQDALSSQKDKLPRAAPEGRVENPSSERKKPQQLKHAHASLHGRYSPTILISSDTFFSPNTE
jgi:hypothetical protein